VAGELNATPFLSAVMGVAKRGHPVSSFQVYSSPVPSPMRWDHVMKANCARSVGVDTVAVG
jgi:hypothetical protein